MKEVISHAIFVVPVLHCMLVAVLLLKVTSARFVPSHSCALYIMARNNTPCDQIIASSAPFCHNTTNQTTQGHWQSGTFAWNIEFSGVCADVH
ncbi:uncharacterized protein F5891DRAFT_554879 [Suillus fuscotomentosus]|uniref:Uncharacterized protein n=1 Tax=Suillus fuscotomentosus TaxID=1912939 RepID=A0AAD4HRS0_9AGAM|nr:uncharacterized protein F5891DRAFT_554879 [Suillus fuscotomentosus]KAG1906176.1 hypothetical protein F5891DRAFT_554879 [Suillus fuscotomentosus]